MRLLRDKKLKAAFTSSKQQLCITLLLCCQSGTTIQWYHNDFLVFQYTSVRYFIAVKFPAFALHFFVQPSLVLFLNLFIKFEQILSFVFLYKYFETNVLTKKSVYIYSTYHISQWLKPGLLPSGIERRFLFLLLSLIDADWRQHAPASMSDNNRNN